MCGASSGRTVRALSACGCGWQAIQECGGELLVGQDLDLPREGQVRGDQSGAPLVAPGEQVEEQLPAGAVERDTPELVDDQQVGPSQPPVQPAQGDYGQTFFHEMLHTCGIVKEDTVVEIAKVCTGWGA